MLTEQDFINIEKQAIGIYQDLELQIIERIKQEKMNNQEAFGFSEE